MNAKPEKVIVRIPRRVWKSRGLAFCMHRKRAFIWLLASILAAFSVVVFSYFVYTPLEVRIVETILWTALFSMIFLTLLPAIFIRKDCFGCQFGFHIVAHERNHLLLQTSNEEVVEEETLGETASKLIPILLSNRKICKGCVFSWRKMYCVAAVNYVKKETNG